MYLLGMAKYKIPKITPVRIASQWIPHHIKKQAIAPIKILNTPSTSFIAIYLWVFSYNKDKF